MRLLSIIALAIGLPVICQAQYQTVFNTLGQTNTLTVPDGEAVRLVNLVPWSENYGIDGDIWAEKFGRRWSVWKGDVLQGPVTFYLTGDSMLTTEALPNATPPGRTLILPQGTNSVVVTLEVSTNLTHWTATTNGVYTTGETPQFFRIRADR